MKREKGFSLIEALVAMAILLVVLAGTLGTLQQAIHTSEAIAKMADVQDNLRAGMNLMVRDIVQSGSGIPIAGIQIPFGGVPAALPINRPSPPTLNYTFPLQPNLTAITPGWQLGLNSVGIPTDMITVTYADNSLPWPRMAPINNNPPIPSPSNPKCNGVLAANGLTITFDTVTAGCATLAAGNASVTPGDLIMLTDATTSIIQEVTNVAGNVLTFSPGDAFGINGVAAPSGTIASLNLGAPIKATRIWMVTYYIDTVANPLRPQLMRQVNFRRAQAVGQVIESLQITYDITNPVGTPLPGTNAGTPVAPDTPTQIRKVNIYMAARSETPDSVTRQFFRTNLWTQVSMRSLSFQSRYN